MVQKIKKIVVNNQKELLIVFFTIGLLLFFATWRLPYSPATWFDEGIDLGVAKSLVTKGVYSLEIAPGQFVEERSYLLTVNYPVLFPVALSLKLFGINLMAARLPMVIYLLLFSLAIFFLARSLYGKKAAILSLALLITFVPFYGNGKAVLGEVPGLFYFLAGLLILRFGRGFKGLFLTGLCFGLSVATKPFFLIILPALLVGELYSYKFYHTSIKKRLLGLGAGLILPLFFWLVSIMPEFSFSAFISTFKFYSNSYAATDFGHQILINLVRFFTESTAVHFLILLLSAVGIFFLQIRKKHVVSETEVIIGVFILLNLFWYLKTPGWYRYFFPAHLLLFLFFPAFLLRFLNKKLAIFIVLVLLTVQTVHLYQQRDNPLYNSSEVADFANVVYGVVKPNEKIFIVNGTSVAFLLGRYQVTQYLHINPSLFFGSNTLVDSNGQLFPYIVVSGSFEGDKNINNLFQLLSSSYDQEKQVGHLILYKRKLNK